MTEYTVPTPEIPETPVSPEVVAEALAPVAKTASKRTAAAKKATKKTATTAKKTAKKTATTAKKTAAKATATAKKTTARKTTTAKAAAARATKPAATAKASSSTKLLEVPVTRMRSLLAELPEPSAVRSRVEGELLVASKAIEDLVAPVVALVTGRTAEGRKHADSVVKPYVTSMVEKGTEGRKAVEDLVGPMLALVAERTAEGRKAADSAVAPYLKSIKPYVATVQAQTGDAVKAAETVVEDLRARADARAAFASNTVTPVVTEIRERTDKAVAEVRKAVGR
jgi:hypothetical protein